MLLSAALLFLFSTAVFPSIVQGAIVFVLLIVLGFYSGEGSGGGRGQAASAAKPAERKTTLPTKQTMPRSSRLQVGDNVLVPAPAYGCPSLNAYNEAKPNIVDLSSLSDPVEQGDIFGHMRPEGRLLCPVVAGGTVGTLNRRSSWSGEESLACIAFTDGSPCIWMDDHYLAALKNSAGGTMSQAAASNNVNQPERSFLTFGASSDISSEPSPSDFGAADLPVMAREYEANQARFMRTYRGKSFAARLSLHGVSEHLIRQGAYSVTFGKGILPDALCDIDSPTNIDFIVGKNKGDILYVRGTIRDRTLGALNLGDCQISE